MISADAPILFSKACELFILELTLRSWMHTEDGNRRTLQRADIANAISDAQVLDFLLDIVPKEEGDEDVTCRNGRRTMPRLATGIHFPVMGANQVHQNYQTGEEVTGGNRGEDLSLWFNGVHFPAVGLNHLHQHCNYEEEMIGANLGGGQSQQFTGMHFPLLGLNNFDQNNYFVSNVE
ncbi:hypothetical protein IFM89_008911 [Coptis chinensis]|uniref:Core Histone H2A/H2B/H3 domain-containing protein n=1 Tax=Coptis chinensis TaxID=261450 RepID=A0A835LEN0_9MAGN|nr:hypothetical protein IFM89_008911 [Coptis chinensis]